MISEVQVAESPHASERVLFHSRIRIVACAQQIFYAVACRQLRYIGTMVVPGKQTKYIGIGKEVSELGALLGYINMVRAENELFPG